MATEGCCRRRTLHGYSEEKQSRSQEVVLREGLRHWDAQTNPHRSPGYLKHFGKHINVRLAALNQLLNKGERHDNTCRYFVCLRFFCRTNERTTVYSVDLMEFLYHGV